MKEKVYERLISFGYPITKEMDDDENAIYTVDPTDDLMLTFIIEKHETQAKSECNSDMVPEEILPMMIDNIVGEFFMSKKNMGQLAIDDIDFSDVAKSIQEGDTNISFESGSSPAAMFDVLLSYLLKPIDFSDFRKIRW